MSVGMMARSFLRLADITLIHLAVPVVAVETHGANSFYESVGLNDGKWNTAAHLPSDIEAIYNPKAGVKLARLSSLPSRATSLGSTSPSGGVVRLALNRAGNIRCVNVPDEMAMQAVCKFAGDCVYLRMRNGVLILWYNSEDHKMLVELACGATLALAYSPSLLRTALPSLPQDALIVFIVCGGFKISLAEVAEYSAIQGNKWEVACDGEKATVEI